MPSNFYEIRTREGSPPELSDAVIAMTVDHAVDLEGMTWAPDALVFVAVVAVTLQGTSAVALNQFRTNSFGKPRLAPSPATNVRVEAVAGGKIRVSWEYHEQFNIAIADTFAVSVFEGEPGSGAMPLVKFVPANPPAPYYSVEIQTYVDWLWLVRVVSLRVGVGEGYATGVFVRTDSTGPTPPVLELTVL